MNGDGTIDVNEGAGALIQSVGDVYLNRSMQKASSIDVHDAAALPALLRALPAASRLMMLVDDDDDCALDQKEFANGLRLLARAARALGDVEGLRAVAALPAERTRLNRMFAKADINGDGKLDINEWVFFVEQLGIAPLLAQHETLPFSCMLVVALEKEKAAVGVQSLDDDIVPAGDSPPLSPNGKRSPDRGTAAGMLELQRRGSLNLIDDCLIRGGGSPPHDSPTAKYEGMSVEERREAKEKERNTRLARMTKEERHARNEATRSKLRGALRYREMEYEQKVLASVRGTVAGSALPPKYKKLLGVLREFDCDGDGIMNLGELRLMLKMLHERAGEEPPPVAHLLKVFEQAHGGRHPEELNVAELDAVLAECPFSVQMAARQGASGSPTGDRWARNTTFVGSPTAPRASVFQG